MNINYAIVKNLEINNNSKKIKVFNYGLAILKSFSAFYVIIFHNFKPNTTKNKVILYITSIKVRHVQAFFIMSFCCICNNLLSLNIKILIKRIERLLIPYILWPITIWTINDILSAIFSLFFLFFSFSYTKNLLLFT